MFTLTLLLLSDEGKLPLGLDYFEITAMCLLIRSVRSLVEALVPPLVEALLIYLEFVLLENMPS